MLLKYITPQPNSVFFFPCNIKGAFSNHKEKFQQCIVVLSTTNLAKLLLSDLLHANAFRR